MNSHFDNILTEKIKRTFRELEVPYEHEHWELLKTELESTGTGYFSQPGVVRIAAAIILGISLGLFYFMYTGSEDPGTPQKLPDVTEQRPSAPAPVQPPPLPENLDHRDPGKTTFKDEPEDIQVTGNASPATESSVSEPTQSKPLPVSFISASEIKTYSIFTHESSKSSRVLTALRLSNRSRSEIRIKTDNRFKRPEIGIFASPSFGFSKAETGFPIGLSAGFTSAFSLHEKVSITSGLIVTHQNLRIEDTGNEITRESSLNEVRQMTNAKILALDIPMNIRFQFRQSGFNQSYLSVGISSYLYLDQEFLFTNRQVTEEIVQHEDGTTTVTRTVSDETSSSSEPALSGFDAAGFLNISLGFQQPITTNTNIVFEPYLKYPIGSSLTARNVHFGSGGMYIRIVF